MMNSVPAHDAEDLLVKLIHELRQPLSTIENSAYYTQMLLPPEQARAHAQLRIMEQQAEGAASLLSAASAELARLRALRGQETLRVAPFGASNGAATARER
ncbi:MAG TPA: hypothetical protein VN736_19985 [Candidatus Limnocylindrales bacterium]|nr:hypothetical protein [Candidatus Limnocylindrales bacterium]